MATPTELFINSELPKRPYTNQFPLDAGHVPVATGNGLEVEARALTTSDISGMSNYATQEDLSNVLAGLWDDRGAYTVNAAGNINYPSSAGSGVAGALMKGDIFTVAGAVAGVSTINNIAVNNGDTVRALVDNPSATDNAHWAIAENNIGYVPENRANKTTNTDLSGATGTYPDTPTVKSYIDKYDISAASISSTGTVTLTRTASNLTFQVPTAISGLSFDANTGVLTSSYTNNATSTTITVAANEVSDNVFRIKDNDDATKKIAFQASGIAAGETRTITMPDVDVDLGKVPTNLAYTAATATLTQTLTDNTSLSADLSAIAVNQLALTGGSIATTVTITGTQASTKYFLASETSLSLTFDVTAFTNTGKFIEIVNNTGGYRTITIVATGKSFKDEVNDNVAMPIILVRGESVFVFPVSATALQVYRNKPDIRNIKNNANTITSGFKTTNLFVDSSTTVGHISASGDEILRIFALSSATINFGANVYDARTDTQISTGSYTLYAGQVLEVTKTSATKWVVLGGHIQDTSRFRLYNSSNVSTKFDTSAATAERTITMPDRDVDLGQVGLLTSSRITPTDSGSITLQSNKLYHVYQPSGGITSYTFILPSAATSGDIIEIHDSGNNFAATTTLIFRANKTFLFPQGISASVSGSAPNIEWTDIRRATNKRWKFTYYTDYGGFWLVEELGVGGAGSPELSAMRKANSSVGVVHNIDAVSGTNKTITYPNRDVDLGNVAQAASTSTTGYLTSADWNTFNNKLGLADVRYVFLNDSTTTYTVPASAVTAAGRTIIELSNGSLTSITINAATGTGKVDGDSVNISITGDYAAQVLAAGAGVTLQGDLTFSYQHQTKTLIYKGTNTWKVVG